MDSYETTIIKKIEILEDEYCELHDLLCEKESGGRMSVYNNNENYRLSIYIKIRECYDKVKLYKKSFKLYQDLRSLLLPLPTDVIFKISTEMLTIRLFE